MCAGILLYKQVCLSTVCVNQKEGRAIRNQTEAISALCPLFLKAHCDHFGPREENRMKEGSKQVAKRESKRSFPRLLIQCLPASLL